MRKFCQAIVVALIGVSFGLVAAGCSNSRATDKDNMKGNKMEGDKIQGTKSGGDMKDDKMKDDKMKDNKMGGDTKDDKMKDDKMKDNKSSRIMPQPHQPQRIREGNQSLALLSSFVLLRVEEPS